MGEKKKSSHSGRPAKMPEVCIGFEVHQPFRLNRTFSPDPKIKKKDLDKHYFDYQNREILDRVTERCYAPATELLLEKLDDGFACAFSLSGTIIEQLEKWNPDMLSLFDQVARHKNTELLAQTYYHSIAGCFDDKSEFEDQVTLHSDLMHDMFGFRPSIFVNTEFAFNNQIATHIKKMGFQGIFTEGVDRILGTRSPNNLYTCRDLAVFLRNIQLSDDIAIRFSNTGWDKYPLTAGAYATWLATSPGDIITIFLDYETFGEHFGKETGILEFLRYLPVEMAQKGIKTPLPSQVITRYPHQDSIDVVQTISQADIGKDTSTWMGNTNQQIAFSAIQKAKAYAADKKIWRYLQASDHFSSMASPRGTSGVVHASSVNYEPEKAFRTYMEILADFEKRNIWGMKKRKAAKSLRTVPPDQAFHFADQAGSIGYTAYNLDQFYELLNLVSAGSISYHLEHGDFSHWIQDVLDEPKLAESIKGCTERADIITLVHERRELLWNL